MAIKYKSPSVLVIIFMLLISLFITVPSVDAATRSSKQHMYTQESIQAYASRSTSSKKVLIVPKHVYVAQLSTYKSWANIQYNEKIVWVPKSKLAPLIRKETAILNQTSSLYTTKSVKSKKIASLKAKSKVEVKGYYESWALIKFKDTEAWIAKKNLTSRFLIEEFIPRPYGTLKNISLYESYLPGKRKITIIPSNARFTANKKYNGWVYVTYNNQKGWVSEKDTIQFATYRVTDRLMNTGDSFYTDMVKDLYNPYQAIHSGDPTTLSYGVHGKGFSQVFSPDVGSPYRYTYFLGREDSLLARKIAAQSLVRLGVEASSQEIYDAINKSFTGEIVDVGNAWVVADGLGAAVYWND